MANMTNTTSNRVGITDLLALLFIGLKLSHIIFWPWVWVLSPIWIGALFLLVGKLLERRD